MEIKNAVKQTAAFTVRNIKIFFKDKGTLISAFISPLIILVLYILFLDSVLKDSFSSGLDGFPLDAKIINGFIASFEVSSILSTCTVTVAFVANMAMVSDKISGARTDLMISPTSGVVLTLGYYFATAFVTLAIGLATLAAGFIYIAAAGWGISVGAAFAAILDVMLGTLFGTALSSIVCSFLKSRGAINAVSTIVSTVYGFICGAYYPISQFGKGIARTVMCLPGTYFTGLFRTHMMSDYYDKLVVAGIPDGVANNILDSLDANMYFFDKAVPVWAMYTVAACTVIALVGAFVLINVLQAKKRKPRNR